MSLTGTDPRTKLTLQLDRLPPAGVSVGMQFAAKFAGETDAEYEAKKSFDGRSKYSVHARLSENPKRVSLDQNFIADPGSSLLVSHSGSGEFVLKINSTSLIIKTNPDNRISVIEGEFVANDHKEAYYLFMEILNPFLDRLSYICRVPLFVESAYIRNLTTLTQTTLFVSPDRPSEFSEGHLSNFGDLIPIYALYREAKNSNSPYYRVLCLFKIMEGFFTKINPELFRKAKTDGVELKNVKLRVPKDDFISHEWKRYSGSPMQTFFEKQLQEQFRNALAHFALTNADPLVISNARDTHRLSDVAYVCDLCVRELIDSHERALLQLSGKNDYISLSRFPRLV